MNDILAYNSAISFQQHNKVEIELFDHHGCCIKKEICENEVNSDFLNRQMKTAMIENFNNNLINELKFRQLNEVNEMKDQHFFSHIYLSNSNKAAIVSGKEQNFDFTSVIGVAALEETYSGNDDFLGTINASESRYDIFNKEFVLVFDFPTNAAIGTIQSVGMLNHKQYGIYKKSISIPRISGTIKVLSSNIGRFNNKDVILIMNTGDNNVYLVNLTATTEEEVILKQAIRDSELPTGWIHNNSFYFYKNYCINRLSLFDISSEIEQSSSLSESDVPYQGNLIYVSKGEKIGWYVFNYGYDKVLYLSNISNVGVNVIELIDNPLKSGVQFIKHQHDKYFSFYSNVMKYSNAILGDYKELNNKFSANYTNWVIDLADRLYNLKIDSNSSDKTFFSLFEIPNGGLPQVATQVVLNSPVTKTSLETMKITYRLKIA